MLRDYQAAAIQRTRRAYAEIKARKPTEAASILILSPTGSGKTVIAVSFASGAVAKGSRVSWLANRDELLAQAYVRLVRAGARPEEITVRSPEVPPETKTIPLLGEDLSVLSHRAIWATARQRASWRYAISSIPSIARKGEAPDAEVVVFDEAHHATADTWYAIRAAYGTSAKVILGLTATPHRGDGVGLGAAFDTMLEVTTIERLTAEGWLLPCKVIAPPAPASELASDPLEAWQRFTPGEKAVIFCATRVHAGQVAKAFQDAGVRAAAVDGDTPTKLREKILADFSTGEITVVANPMILTEGWDEPSVNVAICARGCSSESLFLQMVGRVLRPPSGRALPGEVATWIDLRGHVRVFGHPSAPRAWSLSGSAKREGVDGQAVRVCPACFAAEPPGRPACSACGQAYPPPPIPEVKPAQLSEVDQAAAAAEWSRKWRTFQKLRARARTVETTDRDGWVQTEFRRVFGHRVPRRWWDAGDQQSDQKAHGEHGPG